MRNSESELDTAGIEEVLSFLPLLEKPDQVVWTRALYEAGSLPQLQPSNELSDFVAALCRSGLIFPFDWPAWQSEAEKLVDSPDAIDTIDLASIRRLLTTHVRKDRFCEGHLEQIILCGHMAAVLRRLQVLVSQGSGGGHEE
jgi:O-acetyl-ADP-ribose deacetylase